MNDTLSTLNDLHSAMKCVHSRMKLTSMATLTTKKVESFFVQEVKLPMMEKILDYLIEKLDTGLGFRIRVFLNNGQTYQYQLTDAGVQVRS